jgi:hypothetical protein
VHRGLVASIAALALIVAAPASAATPAEKRIAKLEQQVKQLQKQVKQLTSAVIVNFAADTCEATATADGFASTWTAVDQLGQAQVTPQMFFGPQVAIDDKKSCKDIKIARQTATPATLSTFVGLIDYLYG